MRVRIVLRGAAPSTVPRVRWAAGSLALHLAALVALVFWPEAPRPPLPAGGAISVALVGRPPAPPPAASSEAHRAADTDPAPRGASIETREPLRRDIPEPIPEPRPERTEPRSTSPQPRAEPPVDPRVETGGTPGGQPGGVPGSAALDGVVGGSEALSGVGSEYGWYVARVVASLRDHWQRPPLEPGSDGLTVVVTFGIRRDGRVVDPRVESTSGESLLDRSALRAVLDSDPLPPLPRDLNTDLVPARFEFRWHAEQR